MTQPNRKNSILVLLSLAWGGIVSSVESVRLFIMTIMGRSPHSLRPNPFLDVLDFVLHTGPKAFWRMPSGIRIGRGIGTFIYFVFFRETSFRRKK